MCGFVAEVRRQIRGHTKLLLPEKYKKISHFAFGEIEDARNVPEIKRKLPKGLENSSEFILIYISISEYLTIDVSCRVTEKCMLNSLRRC